MGLSASSLGDEGSFGDEQSSGSAGTLAVVLEGQVGMDVLVVSAIASERSHDHSVLELEFSNRDRLEQLGGGCGGGDGGGHDENV